MDPSSSANQENAAPLYITVGPPACGKTTWLKQQQSEEYGSVQDICLDDQRYVYLPLPSQYFATDSQEAGSAVENKPVGEPSQSMENKESDSPKNQLDEVWFGRSIRERIEQDNPELKLVARRFGGMITKEELESALTELLKSAPAGVLSSALAACEAVLDERGESLALPRTTDLFLREALFRAHPETNQSALEAVKLALSTSVTSSGRPVAWGNTNTKANDYREALCLAARTGRPVHFVVYNARQDLSNKNNTDEVPLETELAAVGYEGLLKRNLTRYLETGRYIPAGVIWDMLQRTNALLEQVLQRSHEQRQQQQEQNKDSSISALKRDQLLVRLAGLHMADNRKIQNDTRQQQHPDQQSYPHHAHQPRHDPYDHHGGPSHRPNYDHRYPEPRQHNHHRPPPQNHRRDPANNNNRGPPPQHHHQPPFSGSHNRQQHHHLASWYRPDPAQFADGRSPWGDGRRRDHRRTRENGSYNHPPAHTEYRGGRSDGYSHNRFHY